MPRESGQKNSKTRVAEYKLKNSNPQQKFWMESDTNQGREDSDSTISIEDVSQSIGETTRIVKSIVEEIDQHPSSSKICSSDMSSSKYRPPPSKKKSAPPQFKSTPYRPPTPSPNKLNSKSKSLNSSAKTRDSGLKSQNRSAIPKVYMTPKSSSTMITFDTINSPGDDYNFESPDENNNKNECVKKPMLNQSMDQNRDQNMDQNWDQNRDNTNENLSSTSNSIQAKSQKLSEKYLSDEKFKKVMKKQKRRITSRSKYRLAKLKIKQYKAENSKLLAENSRLKNKFEFFKIAVARLAEFSIGEPVKFEAVSSFEASSQES